MLTAPFPIARQPAASHHQYYMQFDHQKFALASSLDTFLPMLHCSHPRNNRNY